MKSAQIKLNQTQYHYLEYENPGRPKLVMLHGLMVESHCFERMIEYLKLDYHLFLLDLKGHGKTENGKSYKNDYTPEIIAGELHQFYKQVIQEPCYWLGYSLGGQFALKYNALFPETVQKLILIDSSPGMSAKAFFKIIQMILATPRSFKNKEAVFNFYESKLKGLGDYMLKYCMTENPNGTYQLRYDKRNISPASLYGYMKRTADLWEATQNIQNPVLVIKGENSSIMDQSIIDRMKTNMRKAEIKVLEGTAHDLAFSEAEKVSRLVIDFIQSA